MQAHKLEVLVIDFDQIGAEGVKDAICTARYPNHCISPSVEAIQTVEIGPWSDDHPLNNSKTCEAEYKRLFERTTSPISQMTDIPAPPEMETLADMERLLSPPADWDADYTSIWQKLQVAERNKMQWRTYALGLHAILTKTAAAPHAQAPAAPEIASQPSAKVPEGFFDKLADACIEAEIPDSKYQSICLELERLLAAAPAIQQPQDDLLREAAEHLRLHAEEYSHPGQHGLIARIEAALAKKGGAQ